MHNFKKALLSTISFLLIFSLVSAVIIIPYFELKPDYFQDQDRRLELAGTINHIVLGASHALCAVNPEIIENMLGGVCYNLSGSMMTMSAKYYFLEKELQLNPIETVFLELSYDTLTRKDSEEFAIGDEVTLARMDSAKERFLYSANNVHIDDWLNVYSRRMVTAMSHLPSLLLDHSTKQFSSPYNGYIDSPSSNVSLSAEVAANNHHKNKIGTNYSAENLDILNRIIDLCRSYDVRVVIVVTPVSNAFLWEHSNIDEFYIWSKEFCENTKCEFYDFNLIIDRFSKYNDSVSFKDYTHMSALGADSFTTDLCNIITKYNLENPATNEFYPSYFSMEQNSPYVKYLVS